MSKGKVLAWVVAAMLAAGVTLGQEKERGGASAATPERVAPGWIERGFARLERAIERLEARLSGRGGSTTGGCDDMMSGGGMSGGGMMRGSMMGGGMMGGDRPNERWREPGDRR